MKFVDVLKNKVEKEMDFADNFFVNYPWSDKESYVLFISNMYDFLSQACRMLAASASRCGQDLDIFHHRFVAHMGEEKNHEKLVLKDLRHLDENLRPVMPIMKALWQSQYYMIEHCHPLALFGCVAYLESLAVVPSLQKDVFPKIEKIYGFKGSNYLRVHVTEDDGHLDSLWKVLEEVPREAEPHVLEAFEVTAAIYRSFIRELFKASALSESSPSLGELAA